MNNWPIITDGDTYACGLAFWLVGITDAEAEMLASGTVKPRELPAEPVHLADILQALRAAKWRLPEASTLAASLLAKLEPCREPIGDRPLDPPDPDGEGPLVPTGGAS